MAIILCTLIGWWLFSFKAAMVYFGIVAAGTFLMSWFSAFSSVGIAANASREEQWAAFRMLLLCNVWANPWPPLNVVGGIAAIAFHFLAK